MDVGATLRNAREQRGISIEELSRRTKINVPTLRALERGQVERLPGGIFLRGFLRAYAGQVGLDPEDTVRRYVAQFEPPSDPVPDDGIDKPRPGSTPPAGGTETATAPRRPRPRPIPVLLLAAAAIVIAAAGYMGFRDAPPPRLEQQTDARDAASDSRGSPAVASPGEVATSGRAEDTPAAEAPGVIRLEFQASGRCWVAASADGRSVVYRLVRAGEREVIEARDHVVIRVGEPGAFTYRINGVQGRPLGRRGRPTTVRISVENYREFITS